MATQRSLLSFFAQKTTQSSPEQIVKAILTDIICEAVTDEKRAHDGNLVQPKTLAQWKKCFPWLDVMENESEPLRLGCTLCRDFRMKTTWAKEGTLNIQRSSIERHSSSEIHGQALKLSLKVKPPSLPDVLPDDIVASTNVSDPDLVLIRTVYWTMKEELPLDKVNSLLDLQRMNKVEMPYRNLSWDTVTEIQDTISKCLKQELITKLSRSGYFAVLIDESTDITVCKRLSICVRFVDRGTPQTAFLGNIELSDGCAHTITTALLSYLDECGIDISKCVSLATDGASVMMGKRLGVGVQFKSKAAPFSLQSHCVAHRLNLAIMDSIKHINPLKKFSEKFGNLYNYFSASGNRTFSLKQMQDLLEEPQLTIKEPYSIRWLGLKRAVEAVYDCYSSVLATLSSLASDDEPKSKGLHKYFSSYKTALLLGFMLDVHTVLGILCCKLQQENLIFSDVPPEIESTISKLEFLSTRDGNGLALIKSSIRIENDKAFFQNEELNHYSKEIDGQFESVRKEYLLNLIKNIKKRIPKYDTKIMSSLSKVLEPSIVCVTPSSETGEALNVLINHYGTQKSVKSAEGNLESGVVQSEKPVDKLIDGDELRSEWSGVIGMIKGSYKNLSLQEFCLRLTLKHKESFPNMAKLGDIALCMQVTSVECERSFSTQNRIKSKFRSSLGNKSIEALLRVSLCGPKTEDFDCVMCAKQWLVKSRRKKRLMAEYTPRPKKQTKTC